MSKQITTISFFRYPRLSSKVWGFGMMQFAHAHLSKAAGLQFYKLMGSGKQDGFNPFPDWSTYSLLMTWDDEERADDFIQNSKLFSAYRHRTENVWTIYMKNIIARGKWSGKNPFEEHAQLDPKFPKLAVITRATIRLSKLRQFWKYVPTSSLPLAGNKGLIYTKGIGEIPVLQMATFSLWEDEQSLKDFAYNSPEHHRAIQKTRELNWYKEELFSRFQPYREEGERFSRE